MLGDCILAAAFMSYAGPFPSDFREILNSAWLEKVVDEEIKLSKTYSFTDFLASKA